VTSAGSGTTERKPAEAPLRRPVDGIDVAWRSREELLRLADLTLAEFMRHLTRYGGTILEEEGLLLFSGAHPHPNPYRNGAIRLDERLHPAEVLERAAHFFRVRNRPYVLWCRAHADSALVEAALHAGLQKVEEDGLPELFLEELPEELPMPEGLVLKPATDEQTRRDYVEIVAQGWGMGGMDLDLASAVFFHPDSVAVPHVSAFVGYAGDVPVSGAMCFVTHGVALGCQAATVRRLRGSHLLLSPRDGEQRRGLADSCLWAALRHSFEELGARGSVCQTSVSGAGTWKRLGYRPLTSYVRFLAQHSAPVWG
jgi:hypothetical protein